MNALQLSRGFFLRPVNGLASASLVAAAFMISGCAQRESADAAQAPSTTAADAAAASAPTDAAAATGAAATAETAVDPTPLREKLEPDDPAAGMNNRRPDSQKDLKPEPGSPQPAQ